MMDCLRIEWSESIARTVLSVWACAQEILPRAREKPPPTQGDSPCNISVNVALSHINLFFISKCEICYFGLSALISENGLQHHPAILGAAGVCGACFTLYKCS